MPDLPTPPHNFPKGAYNIYKDKDVGKIGVTSWAILIESKNGFLFRLLVKKSEQ